MTWGLWPLRKVFKQRLGHWELWRERHGLKGMQKCTNSLLQGGQRGCMWEPGDVHEGLYAEPACLLSRRRTSQCPREHAPTLQVLLMPLRWSYSITLWPLAYTCQQGSGDQGEARTELKNDNVGVGLWSLPVNRQLCTCTLKWSGGIVSWTRQKHVLILWVRCGPAVLWNQKAGVSENPHLALSAVIGGFKLLQYITHPS